MKNFNELVESLLTNIDAIQKEAYENGFENVRIFNPLKEYEQNKLNLLVKVSENCPTSLYEKVTLQLNVKKIVGCEVNIFSDYELKEEFKPQIIGETKNLIYTNSEDIIRIFAQSLNVPLVKIEGDKAEFLLLGFKDEKIQEAYLNTVMNIIKKQLSLKSQASSMMEISSGPLFFTQTNASLRVEPTKEVAEIFSEMSISSKS